MSKPSTANLHIVEKEGKADKENNMERQKALEDVSKDLLNQLDKEFYRVLREENGGFEDAANAFVQKWGE